MNLLRALATVSGMTLLSRILGFVRDFVIARSFGAGLATDAFFVAFRLPNLLRRMFAEGAFSQAFVPILAEYKNRQGDEAAHQLVNRVATLLGTVVLLISIIGAFAAPLIIYISAPGFSDEPEKFALTVELTRITFPYIFFMSLVALAGGVLNTWSRFAIPAFTPVLLNLSFIGMALFAAPMFDEPVLALAWAVFIGGCLQLLLQLRPLAAIAMLPRFDWHLRDPGVRRVLKLMAPATLGVSVSQISLLMEFPAGMLGVALGTILLPSLSKYHADENPEGFSDLLDWGLRLTLMLTLPAALALAILSVPLIATLFNYGQFGASDVMQTRPALIAYSVGLTGLILIKVLAPGFYARQDIRTPVKIAILTLVATQLMNLAFIGPLKHAGLALSIGLAACLNAGLLYRGLRKRDVFRPRPGWATFTLKLGLALATLGVVMWLTKGDDASWIDQAAGLRALRLAGVVAAGGISYFAVLFLLGFRPRDFSRRAA
jgi:putative peptidoglycan lipid II flippase